MKSLWEWWTRLFPTGNDHENPFDECPDCGEGNFLYGPSGGVSQNVECANPNCGSRFNLAMLPGGPYLQDRISEPHPRRPS